jgi:hypothetical protein
LGLDRSQYSNAVLAKITYAGSNNTSYTQAEHDLEQLAELEVSDKQVRRICKRMGEERVAERDAQVAAYQALPLTQRKAAPAGVTPPDVAAVGVDGGRLQIFERQPGTATTAATAELPESGDAVLPEEDDGDAEPERGRHWREDKIGVLLTMHSKKSEHDPCPTIPASFLNPARMTQLVRELKKRAPPQEEAVQEAKSAESDVDALSDDAAWKPPEVASKQVVATRRSWPQFGPMVATAAWAAGFFAAARKAFLGDGSANNWTLWRNYFSSFEPILDFIHALSYVFAAALAGRGFKEGWAVYERWIQWLWSGTAEKVIAELAVRQAELGVPTTDEPVGSPCQVVTRALTYLQNNRDRMRYASYRQQGLPITSSYVESTIKQINYRVKGTEKFWNEEGAEEILQLRADYLGDVEVMPAHWQSREAKQTGQTRRRRAA